MGKGIKKKRKRILIRNGIVSAIIILFGSIFLTFYIRGEVLGIRDRQKEKEAQSAFKGQDNKKNDSTIISDNSIEGLGNTYIKIELEKEMQSILLHDLYMERKLEIIIEDIEKGDILTESILRMQNNQRFTGGTILDKAEEKTSYVTLPFPEGETPLDSTFFLQGKDEENLASNSLDPVLAYSVEYRNNPVTGKREGVITFCLNQVYVHNLYQDKNVIYIDLKKPKEVYEKIVVIDTGHGGKDPGTHSLDEKYHEKDMNLSIFSYLKEIVEENPNDKIKFYYTRTVDETVFLNPRAEFANDVGADLLLSIHCNAVASPQAYGAEVLYNETHTSSVFSSKDFAEICLEEIVAVTGKVNRGLVEASDKVVVGNAKMAVALVEVAFMTNPEELNFLLQDSNKEKIAKGLYQAITRALEELSSGNETGI